MTPLLKSLSVAITPERLFGSLPFQYDASKDVGMNDMPMSAMSYPQLYALTKLINPKRILEIGTHWGYGMVTMLRAARECQVAIAVDAELYPPCDYLPKAQANIESVRSDSCKIEVIRHDTVASGYLPKLPCSQFDLIYVDGDHTAKGAANDCCIAWRVLANGGWMLIDDIHFIDDVCVGVRQWQQRDNPSIACGLELLTASRVQPRGLIALQKT